jgi:subtilase family serine protease
LNPRFVKLSGIFVCALIFSTALFAQAPDRITLRGHVHPLATRENDRGPVRASLAISRITMMFKMTAAQATALNDLLQRQQDPKSSDYHRWLSPEEYAARFGVSANDRNQVVSWLQSQGFTINEIGRGGRSVTFTGSAAQIQSAFHISMHQFAVNGQTYYANTTEPSVPSEFADLVLGFRALNNFKLKPRPNQAHFTSSVSGNHYLSPSDFATIYDLNGLYAQGIDGTGQSIVIVGQTDINLADIRTFRSLSGLPPNDPVVVLVPGLTDPGTSKADLPEANMDLEWAGAVAPNARIVYVNSANVMDSLQYAIDQNLAPVVSMSYGACEKHFSVQDVTALSAIAQQANAQGMTFVAASGDTGAADCDSQTAAAAAQGLSVDLPASLPYVTGMGGTEFHEATSLWSSTNTASNGSALSYLPEGSWNDTSSSGLAAGGGGSSIYFSKPSWQTGPGVPNDSARDVPDLALNASANHDGYLLCSGGSCVNGFRAASGNLFIGGGTSAAAPTFAAIVALINQKTNAPQGNVNPVLYSLAVTAPAAFHDITVGGNQVPCVSGGTDCGSSGMIGYSAGPGYDQATGLGSIDALNLVTAWPASQTTAQSSGGTTSGTTSGSGSGSTSSSTSTNPTTVPLPISGVEHGSIQSGYVLITPDTNTTLTVPTVTFGTVSGGNVQTQAGITPIPLITDGSLYVDVVPGIGRNVGVAIVNPGTSANVITLTLRDPNGTTAGSPVTVTLSPNQQVAEFVNQLFPSTVIGAGFSGSLRLQGTSGFAVLGLRFSSAEFSTSPVAVTTAASGSTIIALPQFAMGGGWATQLALVNNGSAVASGRIDVYDPSGIHLSVNLNGATQSTFSYSIPAGGSFVLAPRDSNGQSPF